MLDGIVPGQAHTLCDVDQTPFVTLTTQPLFSKRDDNEAASSEVNGAWAEVSKMYESWVAKHFKL